MEASSKTLALESQLHAWQMIFASIDTQVLICATELSIPDILHAQNKPISLRSIADRISPELTNLSPLHRIMRFLARKGIFSKDADPDTGETLYGPTPSSKWLAKSSKPSLAPLVPLNAKTFFIGTPGASLAECVRRGETRTAFELLHGKNFWSACKENPDLIDVYNKAMACTADIALEAVMDSYKAGFEGLETITDVGGGMGVALGKIVRRFPNIRGVNFDQPHVVASAPEYPGVTHVGGDIFHDDIPATDVVLMKWVLHCFYDEDCVRILSNCRRAIKAKFGRLIILEPILSDEEGAIGDISMSLDIIMLLTVGGRERTEDEWKKLLMSAGFRRCNVIRIPATSSIIEAYPD